MRTTLALVLSLSVLAAIPGRANAADQKSSDKVEIAVLSGRPDMVSGGDALIRISAPASVATNKIAVKLNDQLVTTAFHPDPAGHALVGLVSGMKEGDNTLAVFTDGKGRAAPAATLALKNFAVTGPIFAGPHEKPYLCQTKTFKMPDGTTLGEPLDEDCSVKTVVSYVYKSTQPTAAPPAGRGRGGAPPLVLKPLPSLTQLPADVAMTTTTTGAKVPYVVRIETGTIDRSIYQIAVLHDPTSGAITPVDPPKAWNGRLLYSFGGGCPGGWYRQGDELGWVTAAGATSSVVSDSIVGKGYAEASSSLSVAGINCNDTISAEVMMMIKEHFIKTIGKPLFTFSRGGSGGSYQQNQIVDNYPGLIDGIIPSLTFDDVQELTQMLTDSRLLEVYYAKVGVGLTDEQKRAIGGVAELQNLPSSAPLAGRINPMEYCPPALAANLRYDPFTNLTGVRCDIYDHNISLYGRDPATGFARRPIDNTGVQYGLAALNDGTITTAQFLDLNENIGGYDRDGRVVSTRSVADPLALRNAYQTGVITNGGHGLASVPIIDVRPYRDKLPSGDNHLKYHSFAYRERLLKANGTFANEIMLTGPAPGGAVTSPVDDYALQKMDEWLTTLGKDTSADPVLTKIVHAKPADLVDSCWSPEGERIIEPQTFSGGKCNQFYPTFPGPRMVAGSPLTNNILKCQLRPIDANDYKVQLTAEQRQRLQTIFPGGVCDYSKPGVEQQPPTGTWQNHMNGAQ
jgi:hypothetical protein